MLVWVTDGGSSDPVVPAMQELKDRGVTVFIVSTGRGHLLELSAAASAPAERHLRFVDVDDLHLIAQELRGSILEAMQPQHLRASEVSSSGFRLAWPPLLTADSGYYVLEVVPSAGPAAARRLQLPGNATGWTWAGLEPDTDYTVTLLPESSAGPSRPQQLRVRTLPEEAGPQRIVISHARPRSLRVSWAPALGPAAALGYHVQLGPLRGGAAQRVDVPAGSNSTTLQGLAPGTAYLVTVTAAFRSGREGAVGQGLHARRRPHPRPAPRAARRGAPRAVNRRAGGRALPQPVARNACRLGRGRMPAPVPGPGLGARWRPTDRVLPGGGPGPWGQPEAWTVLPGAHDQTLHFARCEEPAWVAGSLV